MRCFACFKGSPVKQQPVVESQTKVNAVGTKIEDLGKQDSAYGLDREALRSQIKKTPGSNDRDTLEEDMGRYGQLIPLEYSQNVSQEGKAADLVTYGPPKPPCNKARLDNLNELGLLNKASGDPQIQHIMQLMCTVFNTNSVLVALLGEDRVYVHDAINFKKGDFGWRMSLCAHTLSPANHQVMIVENPQNDARFAHLPLIQHGMVKFYAGTPIVSSRGHRVGTVSFVSDKPRKFDAEGSQMLINMGELITRELEREWMAANEAREVTSREKETIPGLLRAVDCFNDAVLFVDTSQPKWQILHANAAAQTRLKLYDVTLDFAEGQTETLWGLFQPLEANSNKLTSSPWETHSEKIKAGQAFTQHNVRFNRRQSINSQSSPTFNLVFRCAATTNIDSSSASVGAPAFLPTTASNHQFYFVTISVDHSSQNSTSQSIINALTGRVSGQVPFENVELGALLGKGGYGSVFRGIKEEPGKPKQIVAIKVIENADHLKISDGIPLETSITQNAHHRNIVNTLDFAITTSTDERSLFDAQNSGTPHDSADSHGKLHGVTQVWMMLEYCDCGSLQEASEKGFFRENGTVSLPLVLAVAHDIASGMAFLHEKGIAHGDLTGGNVLLLGDDSSQAGVVAKIADFGLARNLDAASRMETRTYGTVTHMPPELLEKGIFTKATDVYALGVLLWEMWHGVRAWSSLTFAQIITAVVANKKTLSFSKEAPEDFANLSKRCMNVDAEQRPSFPEIVKELEKLQASYKEIPL